MSKIEISIMSPIRWVKVNYTPLDQYNMKHFDDDWAHLLIPQFYDLKRYAQKWQKNDIIYHQFQSEYDPIRIEVWTCKGVKVSDFSATVVPTSITSSTFNVYQIEQALNTLAEGDYYLILKVGPSDDPLYISEILQVKQKHESTRLFEYRNSYNRQSIIFENDFKMLFRVECSIERFVPKSDDVVFIEQSRGARMVSSYPFRTYSLLVGGPEGVPDWIIDKLNRILGNDSVKIDGKLYNKLDNAQWEPKIEQLYPWTGWSLNIQESVNRSALRHDEVVGVQEDEILIAYNFNTKGFGDYDGPAADNIIQIIKIDP